MTVKDGKTDLNEILIVYKGPWLSIL